MVEFSEGKFFPCRELFLTKSSVNRTECSVPFCDRGVFRMFISSTASCTYNKVCFSVTFIIMKLPMLVADIRISGARSRMDMLPDYFEAAATSKNWKIALQLKLRNFCMRPARRIIDTGRASYVWAERAEAYKMVEFSQKIHSLPRVIFDKNCFKIIC